MEKTAPGTLNERQHAYLIGAFYRAFTERHGERGKTCFVKATQYIAEQRGRRMALRALRDDRPLDYSTYMAYGEINFTLPNDSRSVGEGPDCELEITRCAWQEVFREMDLVECGLCYCPQIDRGIVRGFNADLGFVLKSTLHDAPCCDMIFQDAALYPVAPPAGGKRSWAYHCGHYYQGYSRFAQSVFPDGTEIIRQAEEQFIHDCGEAALVSVLQYAQTDFESIDEEV